MFMHECTCRGGGVGGGVGGGGRGNRSSRPLNCKLPHSCFVIEIEFCSFCVDVLQS